MTATTEAPLSPDEYQRKRLARQSTERHRLNRQLVKAGVDISNRPAPPVRDHLRALNRIGWSWEAISQWYGYGTHQGIRRIALTETTVVHRNFAGLVALPLTVAVSPRIDPETWVPALGAERRVQGLVALGYTHAMITAALDGYDQRALCSGQWDRVTAETWRKIRDATRALGRRAGPSTRNRRRAIKLGYATLHAWDDIDNPREWPKGMDW